MENKWEEAVVKINGTRLGDGHAMTIRVSLNSFAIDLEDGLGSDEHGKVMTIEYRKRISEILRLMADRDGKAD